MNRRMPNGTYGGVRGWGREAPAYSIAWTFPEIYRSFIVSALADQSLVVKSSSWYDKQHPSGLQSCQSFVVQCVLVPTRVLF